MKLSIIGTAGIPSCYGGFETLAENLVRFAEARHTENVTLSIYCSSELYDVKLATYCGARLRYLRLKANGAQSILYDAVSLFDSIRRGDTHMLVLGVSGALMLPLVRLVSRARIVTNIDGIEWRREKWNGLARFVLRISEWAAVRFSHEIIADNQAIADHVLVSYGNYCHVIAYGGDHALILDNQAETPVELPPHYVLALCRVEPENNVHVILEALEGLDMPLVFVGNWNSSAYGRELKARYSDRPNLYLLDPIYEPATLYTVRARASVYLHGHSAGGTNPSLVEMMHFGIPILAYDCAFNQHSTERKARYFQTAVELAEHLRSLSPTDAAQIGFNMHEIAQRKYTWEQIGKAYFDLLDRA